MQLNTGARVRAAQVFGLRDGGQNWKDLSEDNEDVSLSSSADDRLAEARARTQEGRINYASGALNRPAGTGPAARPLAPTSASASASAPACAHNWQ